MANFFSIQSYTILIFEDIQTNVIGRSLMISVSLLPFCSYLYKF